jgi:hypothetical protein
VRDGAVDVDRLADLVWGDDEGLPEHPAGAVRTYITGVPRGFRTVGPIGWAVWNRRDGDYEA